MAISDSTVAILGTGNNGSRLAATLAAGGLDFLLAGRNRRPPGRSSPAFTQASQCFRRWWQLSCVGSGHPGRCLTTCRI